MIIGKFGDVVPNAVAWEDRAGRWGYRQPAIYISRRFNFRKNPYIVQQAVMHELGHWYTGSAHSTTQSDIMYSQLYMNGNWTQKDWNRFTGRLAPKPNVPKPWTEDDYWAKQFSTQEVMERANVDSLVCGGTGKETIWQRVSNLFKRVENI